MSRWGIGTSDINTILLLDRLWRGPGRSGSGCRESVSEVYSFLLDCKNRVTKVNTVSVGILDSSLVHPREVFKDAIIGSAASIIVAHNHPSGDPTPSIEDKRVTQRLYEAGQLLGIDLLDHIVIGDNKWVSLKQIGAF